MIHRMLYNYKDGTYTISSHGMWLPGYYSSSMSANYAFQFTNIELEELEKRICHFDGENRAITIKDLQEVRQARK